MFTNQEIEVLVSNIESAQVEETTFAQVCKLRESDFTSRDSNKCYNYMGCDFPHEFRGEYCPQCGSN